MDEFYSDESYTGEVSESSLSLDYVRQKGREFQSMLNGVSEAESAIYMAIEAGVDELTQGELLAALDEIDAKRWTLRATMEAFNAGAAAINAMGGRMPSLSMPQTLGIVIPAIPVSMLVAIAGVTSAVVWGVSIINRVFVLLDNAQALEAQDSPEARAALARAQQKARDAVAASNENPLASVANIVKWGAFAALGFLAFRAFQQMQSTRSAA